MQTRHSGHPDTPPHIPSELAVDFDFYNVPGLESGRDFDLHSKWKAVQDSLPRLFWTPHYGGHWIATRFSEVERLVMEPERFSSSAVFVPAGNVPFLIPAQSDPPDHGMFRRLLMQTFAPKSLAKATDEARNVTISIIEKLEPQGRCEFVSDFAGAMPIIAFLELIQLPREDHEFLRNLAAQVSRPVHPGAAAAWGEISSYVRDQIELRRRQPREDIITELLNAAPNGRKLSEDEIFSMCLLLVAGGLDTVVSMTSFAASFLAQNPGHRRQLIERPELLNGAVEEITRRFGTSNLARKARYDTELAGVPIREGDVVLGLFPLAGLDDEVNPEPMCVDWERKKAKHLNFGSGPHLCLGMHLAKREIRIFLEEWLKRIPDFHLTDGAPPVVATGIINSVVELNLEWKPQGRTH